MDEPRDFTSEQEARDWLDVEFGAWEAELTLEQREALRSYKGLSPTSALGAISSSTWK